jgi:methylmalonyl-CoA/ethylmalonyl-CoA epimerase
MDLKFSHLAYAIEDIELLLNNFKNLFEVITQSKEEYKQFAMYSQKIEIGEAEIELMEPNGKGVIKDFIEKQGTGFHHIAFQCDDLTSYYEGLKKMGIKVIKDPSDEMRYFFIHPESTGGILVEVHE